MDAERSAALPGFTVVEVRDPAELDERARLSRRLPSQNASHSYILRDKALLRAPPSTLLGRYAARQGGDLQVCHVDERYAMEVTIGGAGVGAYCFGMVRAGRMGLAVPGRDEVDLAPGSGPIHRGQAGTRALTTDGTFRTNIFIAAHRLEAALQASLGEVPRAPLMFEPRIDWTVGAGVGLRRLLIHAVQEFGQPGGLADNAVAVAAFTDLFVHTALQGLPHSLSARLAATRDGPAPHHLYRAEAWFHAHADQPVRLEDAAAAAGCSVRTLQRAFLQFRGMTPHAALLAVRLERARADLAVDGTRVAEVARRYGFTHQGRFATAYARQFGGQTPSETVKQRRSASRSPIGMAGR